MSRIGKSIKTETKLAVAQGWRVIGVVTNGIQEVFLVVIMCCEIRWYDGCTICK
jgi:hypothetical protein